jgi:hypothetical protein
MRASQPKRHTASASDERPGAPQRRTTSPTQRTDRSAQISAVQGSRMPRGRARGVSGRQSFAAPASRSVAVHSSKSSAQPRGQRRTMSQGQRQAAPSPRPPHRAERCAPREASTVPLLQRRRPSEQSVPDKSIALGSDDTPCRCASIQRVRHPRSQLGPANTAVRSAPTDATRFKLVSARGESLAEESVVRTRRSACVCSGDRRRIAPQRRVPFHRSGVSSVDDGESSG